MRPNSRMMLVALVIIGSSLYGLLVVENPAIASAVATGYVAVFLTIFALVNFWKSP